jgi:hypothetical protein
VSWSAECLETDAIIIGLDTIATDTDAIVLSIGGINADRRN